MNVTAKGGVVDVIYLDFAKAFDTVPHRRLIGKLEAYGIFGNILNWVKAFLRREIHHSRRIMHCFISDI